MKTVFNKLPLACLTAVLTMVAWTGSAQVFYSVRALLGEQFRSSTLVDFVRVKPTGAQRTHIEKRVGYPLERDEYIFYVARTDDKIDGYALFDQEIGQHEYIDFATFFDASGKVLRVEVVAYREPYGEAIRSKRFRRQFVGKDDNSRYRLGRDIDVISGATLSARAMTKAVHRASVLLQELVLPQKTE